MAELVIALDFAEPSEALDIARALQGEVAWCKVGLELFAAAGPDIVSRLRDMGFKVFLDGKFFDIPNTVRGAVAATVRAGANMCNLHLLGGEDMIDAALEGRELATSPGAEPPLLLGVTLLTSLGPQDLPWLRTEAAGGAPTDDDLAQCVVELAQLAADKCLDGVVCSPHEARDVKMACGPHFLCLTPGIRPGPHALADDQRRITTPARAVRNGADFLVVGRPVTRAGSQRHPGDPVTVCRAIIEEMAHARNGPRQDAAAPSRWVKE